MLWQLVLETFGPNIQHISGVDNIVADTISRLPSTSAGKYKPITRKSHYCINTLFAIVRPENNEYFVPLNLMNVQIEKKRN